MTYTEIFQNILAKKSFLCIGLDTDLSKIPKFLLDTDDPIFEFNKRIIDATKDLCVAYKPNIAFYEAMGIPGWQALKKTIDYIPSDIFIIADAKRGDIGNTTKKYAEAFFKQLACDAITVAPYMGVDSVSPFLEYDNKWAIVLGLTSNEGSQDYQMLETTNHKKVYQEVIEKSAQWGSHKNMMYVIGATHPEKFQEIRDWIPEHFLLVPGIGAQGGDLEGVAKYGMNDHCGLLVNSSRGIIYAGNGKDFEQEARKAAKNLQEQMAVTLKSKF